MYNMPTRDVFAKKIEMCCSHPEGNPSAEYGDGRIGVSVGIHLCHHRYNYIDTKHEYSK